MDFSTDFAEKIFSISNQNEFEKSAIQIFNYQSKNNSIFQKYLQTLKIKPSSVTNIKDVVFLPVDFFKSHKVIINNEPPEIIFSSSGTTGQKSSNHFVSNLSIYKKSFVEGFVKMYGDITEYCILALLPSYMEREGSSLVYMADELIKISNNSDSGFFLNEFHKLAQIIQKNEQSNQRTILLGVSFALLQFSEQFPMELKNTIVMETGGMKGRQKEITKEELHRLLKQRFNISSIHSEYGMTELLSQAYSKGNGRFFCQPWMQVYIRDVNDPFCLVDTGKIGGINIIDLANINSCSFIETCDLGKKNDDDSFEVLGRFDNSDIRGCNLMVAE